MKTRAFAFLAVVSALLFALLLLTCVKKSPTAPEEKDFTGTISGYVYSRLTAKAAPGVLVSINADSAQAGVTDARGKFIIGSVKAGTHELHFTHADHEDTSGIVVSVEKGEEVRLDDTIQLTYRYYILSGRILYGSSPIPGAGVAVGNTPLSSLVGTDGKFILDRVPKSQSIELICAKSKVGFATQKVSAPVANDTTRVGDIVLTEEGSTVCGTVYDTTGKPMGGVIVAAVGGGLVDTTDNLGRYILQNVPSNTDVRIFVPGQDGLSGAIAGIRVVSNSTLQGVDIRLQPQADLSAGNGMALTVNDMAVIDTARSIRISVYPTTNDTTVIKSYTWTLEGKKTVTITTAIAVLDMTIDSLKHIAQADTVADRILITVVAVNASGEESKPQSFEVRISSARPVVSAKGSDSLNGTRKDTVTIEAGSWAWLFGSAYAPFGGIDTLLWDFGDSTPEWRRTDTIQPISHKYSREGTFAAVFSVIDRSGERVSDTVIIKAIASSIPKPTLVSPADRDTNRTMPDSVTLLWNKVSGSSITYTVYCDSLNNPPVSIVAQGVADTSLRVRIDSGRTVWWTVEAMKSGKSGPTADARRFTGRGGTKPDTSNNPTVFTTKPADMKDTALVGALYKDTVKAADVDNDTIRYSFIDSVAGMTLGGISGIITWTPARSDTGNKAFRVRASDGKGGLDTLAWTIMVKDTAKPDTATGLKKGLVAYYPFNGNAKDESGNGNDGTVNGATLTRDRFGMGTCAYSFNGNGNYIDCGVFNPAKSNAFSMSAWISAVDTAANAIDGWYVGIFFSQGNAQAKNGYGFQIDNPVRYQNSIIQNISACAFINTAGPGSDRFVGSKTGLFKAGAWHHFAGLIDGQTIKVYLDTQMVACTTFTGQIAVSNLPISIGRQNETGHEYWFKGSIDDIYVYNRPLAESEIDSLYREGGWAGNPNFPPIFSSKPTDMLDTATVGKLYKDTVHARDADREPLTFTFMDSAVGMQLTDSIITWTPAATDTGNKKVSISAIDNNGARDTLTWTISVRSPGPHTIAQPAAPSGPQNGAPGTKYGFMTTPFKCSHNDSVHYRFSWGNGTYGAWRNNFMDSVIWPSYGIYNVQVQARCAVDTAVVSDTSQGFWVGVLNSPDGTLFDDCDGDTGMKKNRFGAWWYVYDDRRKSGNSVVHNADSATNYNGFNLTPNEGNPFGSGAACAKIVYTLGTIPDSNGVNFVGIGSCLADDCSSPHSLTGLTKIIFWAKASVPTNIQFKLKTVDILDFSYYDDTLTINTSWQKYEVPINSLSQPSWGSPQIALHLDKVNGIEFQINKIGSNPQNGTIWIDDIYLQGYTWKP